MERDIIGWSWQDWLPHVIESIEQGEFEVNQTVGFQIGDTVRITSEDLDGQQGELKVIDPEASEGEFFGVYLDSTTTIVYFCADEIEKVEIR